MYIGSKSGAVLVSKLAICFVFTSNLYSGCPLSGVFVVVLWTLFTFEEVVAYVRRTVRYRSCWKTCGYPYPVLETASGFLFYIRRQIVMASLFAVG
jgi:hypothetical protein